MAQTVPAGAPVTLSLFPCPSSAIFCVLVCLVARRTLYRCACHTLIERIAPNKECSAIFLDPLIDISILASPFIKYEPPCPSLIPLYNLIFSAPYPQGSVKSAAKVLL